jgi:hypothetical protein
MIAAALVLAALLAAPDTGGPVACVYKGDPQACFPYGCVPVDEAGKPRSLANPDLVPLDSAGRCGVCTIDDECGGAKCRKPGEAGAGTCAAYKDSPVPRPFRPRFGLMVGDLSFNFADSGDPKPILGVGFLGQISLESVRPAVRTDGPGFIVPDPPRWYGDLGATAAFSGPTQNLFVSLGVTYYLYAGPLTTVSGGALYQRQGTAVWKPDTDENRDRLGPSVTLGFMQNLYLRGAYVFGLAGPDHHGAVLVSLIYMRDLFGDLVSDRFRKYLPKAMQGKPQGKSE